LVESLLIRAPVVRMISVIYIIRLIVGCGAAAAFYFIFFSLAKASQLAGMESPR